ncbi:MAG: hypothetical protein ACRD68_04085 [Pyrinomonadaceae bacterium]
MNQGAAEPQIDDVLSPFLDARGEAESEAALEQLVVEHAQPLIRDIIGFKLKASSARWGAGDDRQEVEDVSGEVIIRLIRTLRDYKSSPRLKSIASLRGYVAAMAYNASDEYLRQKYPRRYSLKNKVRYVLTHQPGLKLWEGENRKVLCGLARWGHTNKDGAGPLRTRQDDLDNFLRERFRGTALAQLSPAELVAPVLEFAGSPVEIDELVTVVAEILGIRDARPRAEPEAAGRGRPSQLSSDPRGAVDEAFDRRARLRRVWDEILQLPPRQRAALLLNLRDETGGAAIALLPVLRLATMRQIAEALRMSAEELAETWGRLPLEDAAIAEKMGASRQQVANLRKCARERLSRRLESPRGK